MTTVTFEGKEYDLEERLSRRFDLSPGLKPVRDAIASACGAFGGDLDMAWAQAYDILSQKHWSYRGDVSDDTADNHYHCRFNRDEKNAVVAGFYAQELKGKKLGMAFIKDHNDGSVDIKLSTGALAILADLVPQMQTTSTEITAGHLERGPLVDAVDVIERD